MEDEEKTIEAMTLYSKWAEVEKKLIAANRQGVVAKNAIDNLTEYDRAILVATIFQVSRGVYDAQGVAVQLRGKRL